MINLKALLASATIASTLFLGGSAVQAQPFCGELEGYTFCVETGSFNDILQVTDPSGRLERITAQCLNTSWKFESKGQWTQSEVENFVDGYCSSSRRGAHS